MTRPYPSLSRLRALQAVCATGSFSLAAERLFLTQPAVSAQIRQLESEVGTLLVERIGKTAKPTAEGLRLLDTTDWVLGALDNALEAIDQSKGTASGPLKIGAGATATTYMLPDLLAELERQHPQVKVQILTGNTPDLVPRLVDASLDLAILTAPVAHPQLAQCRFLQDRLVCIAPPEEVEGVRRLRPKDLRNRRLILYEPGGYIRQVIDRWLAPDLGEAEAVPEVLNIGSAAAQVSFVKAGFGWAIISEMAAQQEAALGAVRIVPLAPALSRELVTVWRKDRSERPAIAAALALLGKQHNSSGATSR